MFHWNRSNPELIIKGKIMNSVTVDDSLKCPLTDLESKMAEKPVAFGAIVEDGTPAPPPSQVKDVGRPQPNAQDRGSQIR